MMKFWDIYRVLYCPSFWTYIECYTVQVLGHIECYSVQLLKFWDIYRMLHCPTSHIRSCGSVVHVIGSCQSYQIHDMADYNSGHLKFQEFQSVSSMSKD